MNTPNTQQQYYEVVPLSSGELPPNDDNMYICINKSGSVTRWGGHVINSVPNICIAWLRPVSLTEIIKDAANKGWEEAIRSTNAPHAEGKWQKRYKDTFLNSL